MTEHMPDILTALLAFGGALLGSGLATRHQKKDRKQRLAMAALPKRLKVAQQAYTLWYMLVQKAFHGLAEHKSFEEERKWWRENCLYLDQEARDAFWDSIIAAENYGGVAINAMLPPYNFMEEDKQRRESLEKETKQKLLKFGKIIQDSVELHSWNKEERTIDPTAEKETAND